MGNKPHVRADLGVRKVIRSLDEVAEIKWQRRWMIELAVVVLVRQR
jgi:hypothetical protein